MDKLRNLPRIEEAGFKVDGEPNLLAPRLVIHDVDSYLTEEEVLRSVWRKNVRLFDGVREEDFRGSFKLSHKTGAKGRESVS